MQLSDNGQKIHYLFCLFLKLCRVSSKHTSVADGFSYQFDLISLVAHKLTVNMKICCELNSMIYFVDSRNFDFSQPTHYSRLETDAFWRLDLM